MRIPGFQGLSPIDVGKQAITDYFDDDMNTYASALTYRVLLAIFPFLIFLLTLLDALNLTRLFDWAVDEAQRSFPDQLATQFETIVEQVRAGAGGGLLSLGLIGAIWAAAGGVRSAMNALNRAYDAAESRPFWKLFPTSIIFTLGLAAIVIVSISLLLLGPQAMEWLADRAGLGTVFVTVWTWLRIPTAIALIVIGIALAYYFFPSVSQPFRIVTPGSVIAVTAWLLATEGFSIYLSDFSNLNTTYGSLAGVIVLMLYFYISSITLLAGAEVNAAIFKMSKAREDQDEKARVASSSGSVRSATFLARRT